MSIKITQAAIEAGVRAYWLKGQSVGIIFERNTYDDVDKFIRDGVTAAFTKGVEVALQELSASQDYKFSPQTVQSPPATATQVAIDDEEVERVARAMVADIPGCTWDGCSGTTQRVWLANARAAIRAIREGGQRWGVRVHYKYRSPEPDSWLNLSTIDGQRIEATADREFAERVAAFGNENNQDWEYTVLPYPGERERTPEEIADECCRDVTFWATASMESNVKSKIAAAIRDAKGGK